MTPIARHATVHVPQADAVVRILRITTHLPRVSIRSGVNRSSKCVRDFGAQGRAVMAPSAFNSPALVAPNAPTIALPFATPPTPRTTALGAPTANVGARSALARDSAPLVNSPTPGGTVDRRVTVPETEGRLLTASRLLSPHGTEKRARTLSRARSTRSSSRARRSLCGRSPDTRDARRRANPRGIRGEKTTAPEIALRGRC